jgi:SAM-dependent methyltransferase
MERSYWHRARNAILWRKLQAVWPQQPTVLDIGCGPGIVVNFLRQQGIDCHGVDLGTPQLVHTGLSEFVQLGIKASDLPEAFRQRVKVLLFMDVLEHLPNPEAFLEECERAFPAAHTFYATVPARNELWSNYDEYYGHYKRYIRAELPQLVSRTSFEVIDSGYFYAGLYLAIRVLAWVRPRRPIAFDPPRFDPLQKLIGRFFDLEERCLPKSTWGSSLYAVMRKK